MKRGTKTALAAGAAVAGYMAWSRTGRRVAAPGAARLENFVSYGEDSGRGNLLGVEPYMVPADYASVRHYRSRLEAHLIAARERDWLRPDTVAVFPEYIGTWLVAVGEKRAVYTAPDTVSAVRAIITPNLGAFLRAYAASREADRTTAAAFRMKAVAMARAYDATFAGLAREFGVTIVAGSIVLPAPRVVAGRLRAGDGPLYNVSAVYGPDGRARERLARKAYPVHEEQDFLAGAPPEEAPVFETPAGPVGVLVCADSWYPAPYEALRAGGAAAVVVPSFGLGDANWNAPWGGYSGEAPPDGWDAGDIGRLSEREAWIKYAMPARLAACGAVAGLNPFFRGRLWGMHSNAETLAVVGGKVHIRPVGEDPPGALINVWL